jgi:hypothetical protein
MTSFFMVFIKVLCSKMLEFRKSPFFPFCSFHHGIKFKMLWDRHKFIDQVLPEKKNPRIKKSHIFSFIFWIFNIPMKENTTLNPVRL